MDILHHVLTLINLVLKCHSDVVGQKEPMKCIVIFIAVTLVFLVFQGFQGSDRDRDMMIIWTT